MSRVCHGFALSLPRRTFPTLDACEQQPLPWCDLTVIGTRQDAFLGQTTNAFNWPSAGLPFASILWGRTLTWRQICDCQNKGRTLPPSSTFPRMLKDQALRVAILQAFDDLFYYRVLPVGIWPRLFDLRT